ncbi:MAG TPA: carbohydrate ABC transporter permease [Anaerolineales bacterium]|nr:carbohydrate ABC transporter permease [Anaerolineales bacterium]
MKPFSALNSFFRKLPLNLAVIVLVIVWVIPTLGIFVTSFRSREAVRTSGWWTALAPQSTEGQDTYNEYCGECHGPNGDLIVEANLSDPELVAKYPRSNRMLAMLRQEIDGAPHVQNPPLPDTPNEALDLLAPILTYMNTLAGGESAGSGGLTLRNYADALVGYKGTQDYLTDCEQGVESTLAKFDCNSSDLLNQEGMGQAFLNTLYVSIPSALLPILFAAFAAYAFAWMEFRGRMWIFALLVGLQVIPLQMALVPIARIYSQIGLQSTFLGIWLFHTGFGLPYAIYLMRNFLGGLPREVFESIYIDGANHWTAFWKLAMPLSVPAIASLGIFQFLWIWNDFLVAKIFLTGNPVLTVQITNLIDPRGGNWHILTGAAFLSFIVPMLVFFGLQRFFVRGLTAGSVKG